MATLIINHSDSKCGSCRKGADPIEQTHQTILSYEGNGPGCGETFTETATEMVPTVQMRDAIVALRPDLPFVGSWYEWVGRNSQV